MKKSLILLTFMLFLNFSLCCLDTFSKKEKLTSNIIKPSKSIEHTNINVVDSNTNKVRVKDCDIKLQKRDKKLSYRAGNAVASESQIFYPHEGARINDTTPIIVGDVDDVQGDPVENETINISIDSNPVIGPVTSGQNGIWFYTLTPAEALPDGSHTVTAEAVESGITIGTNTFIIDTAAPPAPVINNPSENETVTSNTVTVSGTAEPLATIYIYIDGSTEYQELTEVNVGNNWSLDIEFSNGPHTIEAEAQDVAGNLSPFSEPPRDFTVVS